MEETCLYIVPTPIGNLSDITLRAIETLKKVDIIFCEDTRTTQKLLNHYEIKAKTLSYHKFSEKQKAKEIIELVKSGKNIALVSDAGTPLISDPGDELVSEATKNGVKIVPLPGACALTTALSGIGNDGKFVFMGFLPKTVSEQEEIFSKYKDIDVVFYESPNRLIKTLEHVSNVRVNPRVSIARELTKIFEEIKTDKAQEIIDYYQKNVLKGEIVVVIKKETDVINDVDDNILNHAEKLRKEGFSVKDISKILSIIFGVSKNKLYKEIFK